MTLFNDPGGWLDLLVAMAIVTSIILGIIVVCIEPSLRRGTLKFWATTALGMCFVLGSVDSIYTRQVAPRHAATGIVSSVERRGGKNPKTDFRLNTGNGGYFRLRADSESQALQDGEDVTADWMIFNGNVLHYRVLTGPHSGEQFQNAIEFESIISLFVGLFLMYVAYRVRQRNPTGYPQKRSGTEASPDRVDDRSLLHPGHD